MGQREDDKGRTPPHGDPLIGRHADILQDAKRAEWKASPLRAPLPTTDTGDALPPEGERYTLANEGERAAAKTPDVNEALVTRADIESAWGRVQVYRISMAYGKTEQSAVLATVEVLRKAYKVADLGLTFGYGLGAWGTEECIHIEVATPRSLTWFIIALLAWFNQECAYVNVDGRPWELNRDEVWSPITGIQADLLPNTEARRAEQKKARDAK